MEDLELKNLWQSYDQKIAKAELLNAQSLALHLRCFADIQQHKTGSQLRALTFHNIAAVLLGVVWVLFLGVLVYGNHFENPYFSTSLTVIAVFTLYTMAAYLRHTVLIATIRYEGNVADTQRILARLQSSTFRTIRIAWLQLPFYSTFFWSDAFIRSGWAFWVIAFPISLLLLLTALYLYRNLRPENMHRKWVYTLMMAGPELKNLKRSEAFLEEVEVYQKEMI